MGAFSYLADNLGEARSLDAGPRNHVRFFLNRALW
jgi:hypothetical protein